MLAELKEKGEIELKPNVVALDPERYPADEAIEGKVIEPALPEPSAESKLPEGNF